MPAADGATILHADLDAFYASVAQRDDPSLRGKAVIVGGGVVLAASYPAKACGVKTAMGGREARRLCPHAVVVDADMEAYSQASKDVFAIFDDTTPLVEGLSIDEAFLDVSGLWRIDGSPVEIAARLRQRVADEVGLPLSVGVASTKFLAKVASGVSKPDGLLEVEPGAELDFLHPLAVRSLWGVGAITEEKLAQRGVHTVGQVATMTPETLRSWLGRGVGNHLYALAHNLDPRQVVTGKRRGTVGSQRSTRIRSKAEAEEVLLDIADRVTARLRKGHRVGRTVVLRLRYDDFAAATRSHTMAQATSSTAPILDAAKSLLDNVWPVARERGLTRLGMAVANLSRDDAVQLALPLDPQKNPALDEASDAIRDKFGKKSIRRAALLGHSTMEVPIFGE